MLDATIGIVTWNSKEFLKRCLDSIYENTTQRFTYRIVVIDNGSEDDTIRMVKEEYPDVTLVENGQNLGVAKARNKVLRSFEGRYVILLDVDTYIMPNSLETLIETMDAHPEAAIGGPKLLNPDYTLQLSCRKFPILTAIFLRATPFGRWFPNNRILRENEMIDWDHNTLREVDLMFGACHIINPNALAEIGLLDEGYFYLYEDTDYCHRARGKGWKVLYIPQSIVIHHYQHKSFKIYSRKTVRHFRSITHYFRKHGVKFV